jgi:hypothetical protein
LYGVLFEDTGNKEKSKDHVVQLCQAVAAFYGRGTKAKMHETRFFYFRQFI